MAKNINGAGFKLYFPDAEKDQPTSSLDHPSGTEPVSETKQTALESENPVPDQHEPPHRESVALRSPSWQPNPATPTEGFSAGTVTGIDKHRLMEHRTSLSIPAVEVARLSEPDQEPNIRSYQDSRRRSSQLAEGS